MHGSEHGPGNSQRSFFVVFKRGFDVCFGNAGRRFVVQGLGEDEGQIRVVRIELFFAASACFL